jgi:hypothetical protein
MIMVFSSSSFFHFEIAQLRERRLQPRVSLYEFMRITGFKSLTSQLLNLKKKKKRNAAKKIMKLNHSMAKGKRMQDAKLKFSHLIQKHIWV